MKLTVNGKVHECPAGLTISALLEQLALLGRRVAVERNGDIVPRSQHAAVVLTEGDQIEIVVAVGGG
jgi:sulfur carrier protein